MKKRWISIVYIFAMLLTSCGGTTADETIQETAALTADTPETVAEETEVHDDIPTDLKFSGETFDIASRMIGHLNYKMNVEELTGDQIDDAIYNRNRNIEDRFEIVITEVADWDPNKALNAVLAGDDTYELLKTRAPMAISIVLRELSYEVTDIPHIDLTKPYWDQNINRDLTIGGKQFFVTGALSVTEYDETNGLLFNKQMIADYQLENPYEIVWEGNWTMDVMCEMMKKVAHDVNGDGQMTDEDRYGYLATGKHVLSAFLLGAGEKAVSKTEEDVPYLTMGHERYYDVIMKTFDILYDTNAWPQNDIEENVSSLHIQMFTSGNSLFMHTVMYFLEQLRDMESDFGIIPYPKYDDTQDKYYSRTSWVEPFMVPVTNSKLDMTGAVIEAMCCESAKTVIPAYYDAALKGKITRDQESAEMLDLIFNNRILCLGDTVWCDYIRVQFLDDMFEYNQRDLASRIAKAESQINSEIEKLADIIPSLG